MTDAAFVNAGQPHGAIFDDAPKAYHVTDAAMLRAAYGPAAVPSVPDPAADDEYTWTEQALPAGLRAASNTVDPVTRELIGMSNAISDLQRDVQYLSELVQRLLKMSKTP